MSSHYSMQLPSRGGASQKGPLLVFVFFEGGMYVTIVSVTVTHAATSPSQEGVSHAIVSLTALFWYLFSLKEVCDVTCTVIHMQLILACHMQ